MSSFSYSEALCLPLISLVLKQADSLDFSELREDQNNIRGLQDLDIDYNYDQRLKALVPNLPPETQKGVELAQQKGASSWVTAMPNEEHGTILQSPPSNLSRESHSNSNQATKMTKHEVM